MIWLSSKKLEYALAEEKLDSWEKVKYLILPAVLGALLGGSVYIIRPYYGHRMPNAHMLALVICGIISAFLVYRGTKQCFYVNINIDNKAFFERFTILLVPPLFKTAVLSIVLCLAISISASKLREEIPFLYKHVSMFTASLGPIITYIFYKLIDNSFTRFGELIKEKNKSL